MITAKFKARFGSLTNYTVLSKVNISKVASSADVFGLVATVSCVTLCSAHGELCADPVSLLELYHENVLFKKFPMLNANYGAIQFLKTRGFFRRLTPASCFAHERE